MRDRRSSDQDAVVVALLHGLLLFVGGRGVGLVGYAVGK